MTLLEKFQAARKQLNDACLERSDEIDGLLIGLLTGINVLLLGTPGTGKSYLVNMFTKMFGQDTSFSWLLAKTSTPEELFGPISMKGLKEDRYEHKTTGKLPCATIALLDEIFKANSSILNSLLTLLNERVFYNGTRIEKTILRLIIGCSNEYPKDPSLDALYDRFGLRYWVSPLKQEKNIKRLISEKRKRTLPQPDITFTQDEIEELRKMVLNVSFSQNDTDILYSIKEALENDNFSVSDRTLSSMCPDIVCASAMINGSTSVSGSNWQTLSNTLWDKHTDKDVISSLIGNVSDPQGQVIQAITDEILTAMESIPSTDLIKNGSMQAIDFITNHIQPISLKLKTFKMDIEDMDQNRDLSEITSLIEDSDNTCNVLSREALKQGRR